MSRLDSVAAQAGQADAALRGVVAWASWRLLGWLMSSGVLWWNTGAIQAVRVEKARLQAEVAEVQANWDEWAKAGFVSKLTRCNPGNRPYVRVDERAGAFEKEDHANYRVIQGD